MAVREIDPHKAIDYMIDNAPKFAAAKADRIHLEEFRKSKKALLMAESEAQAVNAREQYAYAHPEYLALLEALKTAVEVEETLKWHMVAAQARIDVWRSQEASNRAQERATV